MGHLKVVRLAVVAGVVTGLPCFDVPPAWAAHPPLVGSISPTAGPTAGDTVVTVTGGGLYEATSVTFGGVAGTDLTVINPNVVSVVAPAGIAGWVPVRVNSPEGTGQGNIPMFTYVAAPTVSPSTAVSPAFGPAAGGTAVTVTGTGFSGSGYTTTAVDFGGVAGTALTVTSATSLQVTSPAGTGLVDVTVVTPRREERHHRGGRVHLRPDGQSLWDGHVH